MNKIVCIALLVILISSCTKGTNERYLIIKFRCSDTMPTFNDTGKLITNADRALNFGVAGYSPTINSISAHQLAFLTDSTSQTIPYFFYKGFESKKKNDTTYGIDYTTAKRVSQGENFIAISLSDIKPGVYKYLQAEMSYYNFTLPIRIDKSISLYTDPVTGVTYPGNNFNGVYNSTFAGFTGYKTFFDKGYSVNQIYYKQDSFYANRGFFAYETQLGSQGINYPAWIESESIRDTFKTSVNWLFKSRPNNLYNYDVVPMYTASYKKDGTFNYTQKPLTITGAETESIVIEIVLSSKNCIEWDDTNGNKFWDPYAGEGLKLIGMRGMVPMVIK